MKKTLKCLFLALMTITMMSCENDEIAAKLDGIWEGEVKSEYFSHRWRKTVTEYQAVDIEFFKDPYHYAEGEGVEYDYTYINQRTGWTEYVKCRFRYVVRNRNIYLDYEDGSRIAIYNYSLNNNHFRGSFHDYDTGRKIVDFDFIRVGTWRHNREYYRERYSPMY